MTKHNRDRIMASELRHWWRLARRIQILREINPESPELKDYYDEAEVVLLNTEWPRLRERIEKLLRSVTRRKIAGWVVLCALLV